MSIEPAATVPTGGFVPIIGAMVTTAPITPPAPPLTTTRAIVPATQAAQDLATPEQLRGLALVSLIALFALFQARVFKRRVSTSVARLLTPLPIAPLVYNLVGGVIAYLAGAIAASLFAKVMHFGRADGHGYVSPGLLIFISAASPAFAALVVLLGLGLRIPNGLQQIGIGGRPKGKAILAGVGYAIAVLPITLLVANLALLIYQHFHETLDTIHPLLRSMDETRPLARAVGAIAAVFIAPLAEELLFRGHLQTILRRSIARLDRPLADAPLPIDPAIAAQRSARIGWWASAGAIVITSLVFASIHPTFSRAPIFVLSLFLGLAYERTGNLWTPLALHATFNGISTLLFLSTSHGGA